MDSDDYRKKFDELFKQLNGNQERARQIDESTLKIIDHVHTRVSYTEGKRKAALEIGLAFLTFSAALGLLLVQFSQDWLSVLLPFIVSLSLVGLFELSLYILQERFKRPFIETAKTWRWFYHYCIDPELPVGPLLSSEKRKRSIEGYLTGLYKYTTNTLKTTPITMLRQDIEQLFILLTTERLKNEFLKQQQGVLFYGVIASSISLLSNFILSEYAKTVFPEYRLHISVIIFIIALIILYICKVFQVTKSRIPWSYIEESDDSQ